MAFWAQISLSSATSIGLLVLDYWFDLYSSSDFHKEEHVTLVANGSGYNFVTLKERLFSSKEITSLNWIIWAFSTKLLTTEIIHRLKFRKHWYQINGVKSSEGS